MDLPTPFVHRSLRHEVSIRVLVLRPSPRRSAPIRCELQEISLEDAPSYEALSYVWGSPTGTHPISCDGFTMLVTPNCRDALIHLRRRVTRRILWVDAICIDQGESDRSKKERNTQVVQMGKVYQTARRVVIWLGTADQGTRGLFSRLKLVTPYDLAFVLVDEVAKLSEITEKLPKRISKAAREKVDKICSSDDFRRLVDNEWFKRVWTIQEAAFAQKIILYSGQSSLSWGSFMMALHASPHTANISTILHRGRTEYNRSIPVLDEMGRFTYRAEFFSSGEGAFKFFSTLLVHRCSRPHDKVYGVFAMLQAAGWEMLLEPDYDKPVFEVYEEFMRVLIKSSTGWNQLWALMLAVRPFGPSDDFPSWIPDFNDSQLYNEETGVTFGTDFVFKKRLSFPDWAEHVPIPSSPGTLKVHGFPLGVVIWRKALILTESQGQSPFCLDRKNILTFQSWCRRVASLGAYLDGTQQAAEVFMEALDFREDLGDDIFRTLRHMWFDLMLYPECERSDVRGLLHHVDTDGDRLAAEVVIDCLLYCFTTHSDSWNLLASFHQRLWSALSLYQLLILDSGHLAFAWHTCVNGDLVFLIKGCPSPLVLGCPDRLEKDRMRNRLERDRMRKTQRRFSYRTPIRVSSVVSHENPLLAPQDQKTLTKDWSLSPESSANISGLTPNDSQYKLIAPAYVIGVASHLLQDIKILGEEITII